MAVQLIKEYQKILMKKGKSNFFKTILLLAIFQFALFQQVRGTEIPVKRQKLLLQSAAAFYTVVREGRIDLDSSLVVIANRYHISSSRVEAITEGIDDNYTAEHCQWMVRGKVDSVEKLLPKLHGADHARMLLLIGAYYAFYPDKKEKYLKGIDYLKLAKAECDKQNLIQWSAQCCCLIGKCFFALNDIPGAKEWFKKVTDNKLLADDYAIQAKAWNYQGMYPPNIAALAPYRVDCLKRALGYFEKLNDTDNQINALLNQCNLTLVGGNRDGAITAAQKSLTLQKKTNFPYNQFADDILAYIFTLKGDFPSALKYALAGVNSAEITKDNQNFGHFYFRVSNIESTLNNAVEAEKWANKSFNEYKKLGGGPEFYYLIRLVADNQILIHSYPELLELIKSNFKKYPPDNPIDLQWDYINMGICYKGLKQYQQALKYFLLAEKLEKETTIIRGGQKCSTLNLNISEMYFIVHNFKRSRKYLLEGINGYYPAYNSRGVVLGRYYLMYQVDSALNRYKSAMYYLSKFMDGRTSLYGEIESKQMVALNVQYETLQREKRLQSLKAQNELQQQKVALTRRYAYGVSILLGVIIITLYSRYYSNKKSNKLLRVQKEEIDLQNASLQNMNYRQKVLLTEKEWLVREVHHRVKNNLQIIMNLLQSQSAYLKDEAALNAVMESQHRVQAMSLIHQKLYRTENSTTIYMPEYIYDLVEYLKDSFETNLDVYFELKIEKIRLDVTRAIPVGLILNEIITNAFKHAFPHTEEDRITIELFSSDNEIVSLIVTDNGRGFPADYDISDSKSFGTILMKGLTQELEGTFSISGQNETKITITFSNLPVYFDKIEHGDVIQS